MKSKMVILGVAMAVFSLALFIPGAQMAQSQVIELTYGTPYGPDHTFSRTDQKWFAKIEKETNGRVKFKPFWGGAIIGGGPQAIDEVVKGVADVGFISPGQARAGYDIAKANFLFFTGATVDNGYRIFSEVLKKFPEIDQEYKGLKVMAWSSGVQYDLLARKPVRKLEDMKGMRVKTLGEIVAVLKDLGVEGTTTPMPEVYLSMQKGVLDGGFVTFGTFKVLKLADVGKFMTYFNLYRAHVGGRAMSQTTWNKLPPDIQAVFQNNIAWYSAEADKDVQADEKEGYEVGKKAGVEFINLSPEDQAKFQKLVLDEAAKAAATIDAKGLPGSKVFQEAQRLIKEAGKK